MAIAADQLAIPGQKVRLRSFLESDITAAYLSWLNDPVTMRYSNQRFVEHTHASSLRYLQSFVGSPNLFLSIDNPDGERLGTMTAYIAPAHGTADMGILIGNPSFRGQGHGQDAWCALLNLLLRERGLRKITAGTLACNAPMLRLMEKSGMHQEGSRRQQELVDGIAYDILYFARFRDDQSA